MRPRSFTYKIFPCKCESGADPIKIFYTLGKIYKQILKNKNDVQIVNISYYITYFYNYIFG